MWPVINYTGFDSCLQKYLSAARAAAEFLKLLYMSP